MPRRSTMPLWLGQVKGQADRRRIGMLVQVRISWDQGYEGMDIVDLDIVSFFSLSRFFQPRSSQNGRISRCLLPSTCTLAKGLARAA